MVSPIDGTQADKAHIYAAEPCEVGALVNLARKFHEENATAGYLEDFSAEFWEHYWSSLLAEGLGVILYCTNDIGKPVGLLAATVALAHTDGAMQVTETLWYVDPDHRSGTLSKRLVRALETFAVGAEAKRVCMTHLVDDTGLRLSRLFKRWGYKPFEVGYIKEVEL